MKTLRAFGAALVLALTMAVPAFAGHIETPIVPPPSAGTTSGAGTGVAGHMDTGITSTDSLTEAALSLLQSVLALF